MTEKIMIDGKQGPDEPEIEWDKSENDDETLKVMVDGNLCATRRFIDKNRGGWLWQKLTKK